MRKPLISVITPSYNQACFIEQTIASVIGQSYDNIQFIIVDGGSTDGSLDIIKKYSSNLFYWTSEPDSGQSDAINKGLKKATGDLVTWINSDDLLLPGSLQAIADAWMKSPSASLFSGDCIRIDPDNKYLSCHVVPPQLGWFSKKGLVYIDQPGTFWRRDLIQTDEGLDTALHTVMDHDLWYRITLQYKNALRLNRCLAAFRLHDKSKTANIQEIFIKEANIIREKHCGGRKQISFTTLLSYRFLKTINGNYFRQYILSNFPPREIQTFLLDLRREYSPNIDCHHRKKLI
jgi:glycosyltransferase involved in cell wall biosynthesis